MLDAAELCALPLVHARLRRRLEPEVVHLARDRVHLPGKRGHPPAVDDVVNGSGDHELDRPPGRQSQLVHGDGAVRVHVAPVELPSLNLDGQLLAGRVRLRDVLDPRELVEDERHDRDQDQDRDPGPDQLQAGVAADLRALVRTRPAAVAVLDDEEDQRNLDDQEDDGADREDEPVNVFDAPRLWRLGGRRDPAVPGQGRACQHECQRQEAQTGEEKLPAHRRRHSMRPL